jgi:hypothetical protein
MWRAYQLRSIPPTTCQRRGILARVRAVLTIVVVAGCYAPTIPDGVPCAANLACPGSLMCSRGKCVAHPSDDAAVACTPIVAGPGALTAPSVSTIVLDGSLADWPTCFVTLDSHTGIIRDLTGLGDYSTGRFSVAHDATHLYIAAEVTGVPPLGDQPLPDIYENDSISVYLDADGVFAMQKYDADAMQIVVDHANRMQGFRSGALALGNLTTATRTTGSTFTIEMAVQPATLSASKFASTIGFDIGFESGDGVVQTSELVWFEKCGPPMCGCANGMSAPFCDARQLGTVTLAP